MIKIAHIIADAKFMSQIEKFKSTQIENKLIFLGDQKELPSSYSSEAFCICPDKEDIEGIIALCSEAHIVVVYTLFPQIVLRLPKKTKVLWRFFGVELYEKMLPKVLSPQTYYLYKEMIRQHHFSAILKKGLLRLFPQLSSFNRAVKRVDYFFGVFQEEHEMLKSLGFKLPPFLQIPIRFSAGQKYMQHKKNKILLVGNSRTFFNNHIDVLRILQTKDKPSDLEIKMLFSYGAESAYTAAIREEASKLSEIEIIEQFLPKQSFIKIYQEASAVLINSYRQMALGNIFIALQNGTKVYLSEKNITLKWLLLKGFKVASIEKDLSRDLKSGNLKLSESEGRHNFNKYVELVRSYSIKHFQDNLIKNLIS